MQLSYKKRAAERSQLSEKHQHIFDFLNAQSTGVLATVDPNGNPHAVVIYYAVSPDFSVTFTTKHQTKKSDNLDHNNHAMLVAFDERSQTTVQVIGVTEDITDSVEGEQSFKNMVNAAQQTSESEVPPIAKLYAGHYVSYRLVPKQIRMAVFVRPDPGGYDMYETIDF